MKKQFILFIIFLSLTIQVIAQDTIRSHDLPNAGNIFVLSIGTTFNGIQPSETGANFNWDYSNLERSSQRIDTMFTPTTTNPALSFFFIDNFLNTNRANLASRGQNLNLGITGLNDIFNYYYNSSSDYTQPGLGAVINSIPVPVFYTPHDVLYKFPLKYNDEDSVSYEYQVDLTSTIGIYYHVNRSRHNEVDGWGTLTTPYGSFSVLRVKSTLIELDSIYISSLNQGIKLPAVTTFEFKWLGAGFGLPLLQINTMANDTSVTQILYQDSVHLTGISNIFPIIRELLIFPNPAAEKIIIRYSLQEKSDVEINLFSMDGKQIFSFMELSQSIGVNIRVIDLKNYNLADGNYFIKLQAGNLVQTRALQISK